MLCWILKGFYCGTNKILVYKSQPASLETFECILLYGWCTHFPFLIFHSFSIIKLNVCPSVNFLFFLLWIFFSSFTNLLVRIVLASQIVTKLRLASCSPIWKLCLDDFQNSLTFIDKLNRIGWLNWQWIFRFCCCCLASAIVNCNTFDFTRR